MIVPEDIKIIIHNALDVAQSSGDLPNVKMIPWIFVGCFCACCYALQGIIISVKFDKSNDPIIMAFWMNIISSLILLPSQFFTQTKVVIFFPFNVVDYSIIGLGIIEAICLKLPKIY